MRPKRYAGAVFRQNDHSSRKQAVGTAVVLTFDGREVETGANVEPDHHKQMVVNSPGALAFKNAYVIGVTRLNDMGKKGVQTPLGLFNASNVILES